MGQVERLEVISDDRIRTAGIGQRSSMILQQWGTFAGNEGYTGSVRFAIPYRAGTPAKVVILSRFAGSSSMGRNIPYRVTDVSGARFFYTGSGRQGTMFWHAIGSAVAP